MSVSFRHLQKGDYHKGFLDVLKYLTTVGDISYQDFSKKFDVRETNPNMHTFVGEMNGKIACTATLVIEEKYIHNCSRIGHIEDVVVDQTIARQGLGKKLIHKLIEKAKEEKCYKVILDCETKNIPFYQSCGLSRKGNEMALYLE